MWEEVPSIFHVHLQDSCRYIEDNVWTARLKSAGAGPLFQPSLTQPTHCLQYICQYLDDAHEKSKVLPPTSSNPNHYSMSISGASWDLACSGRIFDPDFFLGLARHVCFGTEIPGSGTDCNITEICFFAGWDDCRCCLSLAFSQFW